MKMNELRAEDARAKVRWFMGQGVHPHGLSHQRFVIPYEWDRRMFDGGEWARAAGF